MPRAGAGQARVVALGRAPSSGAPLMPLDALEVDALGALGDRYRAGSGHWSADRTSPITLVATGEVEAAAVFLGASLDPLALRRNVVVRADTLAHWIGRAFRIGEVLLEGERPCDPCRHLEELLELPGLKAALRGRGGLRARVLEGGTMRRGDLLRATTEILHL